MRRRRRATVHSICARFLRRYGSSLGYPPGFQIIDEDDQKKLINDLIKTTAKDPKDFPKKEVVLKMISEAANEQKPIRLIASRWQTKAAGFTPEEIVEIAEKYDTLCAIFHEFPLAFGANSVIDF